MITISREWLREHRLKLILVVTVIIAVLTGYFVIGFLWMGVGRVQYQDQEGPIVGQESIKSNSAEDTVISEPYSLRKCTLNEFSEIKTFEDQGGQSNATTALHKPSGQPVFRKVYRKPHNFNKERRVFEALHATGIIMEPLCFMVRPWAIVMELSEEGDLDSEKMFRGEHAIKSLDGLRDLAAEMIAAMAILHRHGYIHNDVKPANFIRKNGHLKLIDFGLSLPIGTKGRLVQSELKAAPEVFNGPKIGLARPAVDWWPVGVTIHHLFAKYIYCATGEDCPKGFSAEFSPYSSAKRTKSGRPIFNYNPRHPDFPDHLHDLIKILMAEDPKDRDFTGDNLKILTSHPFFNGLNWTAINPQLFI